MDKEKTLINSFYIQFWFLLGGIIFVAILLTLVILLRNKVFIISLSIRTKRTAMLCVLLVFLAIEITLSVFFSRCIMDLSAVRNREFEYMTGTVVAYSRSYEANDGSSIYSLTSSPIFLDNSNGNRIKFLVGPTKLNSTYKIIYLKHTKLAEIVEEVLIL